MCNNKEAVMSDSQLEGQIQKKAKSEWENKMKFLILNQKTKNQHGFTEAYTFLISEKQRLFTQWEVC